MILCASQMVMRHFHPCSSLDFGTAKTMKQEIAQIPRHSTMHTKTVASALGLSNSKECQRISDTTANMQPREAEVTAQAGLVKPSKKP